MPLRAAQGAGIEPAGQLLHRDAAQQGRAGHHTQHRQAQTLQGRDHVGTQGRHLGGGNTVEHHPSEEITQLIPGSEQWLHAAAVLPGMDQENRSLKTLGHLGQAQAIETTIVEASGGLHQGQPIARSLQLLPQLLKSRPWLEVPIQQAAASGLVDLEVNRGNELIVFQPEDLADEADVVVNQGSGGLGATGVRAIGKGFTEPDRDAPLQQLAGHAQHHR